MAIIHKEKVHFMKLFNELDVTYMLGILIKGVAIDVSITLPI